MSHGAHKPLFADFPPVSTEAWWDKIRDDLGPDAEERLAWRSIDGVTLAPFYRAEDRAGAARQAPLHAPRTGWRIRQDIAHADPAEANRAAHATLRACPGPRSGGGATDLGFVVQVESGALRGVNLQTPEALRRALDGLPLEETPLHFVAGRAGPPLLAMLLGEAERQDVALKTLSGSLDFDPSALLAAGHAAAPASLFRRAAQLARFAAEHLPGWRVLAADARPYHEAGASAVQELGCTVAAASELLARCAEHDVAPEQVAGTLHAVVPVGTSTFVELARLRALRLLLRQVIDAYAGKDSNFQFSIFNFQFPPLHAVTSRRQETLFDPHNNLLRATTEAAAAVLGGCDLLAVRPFDAQSAPPGAFSERMARNTQLLLREEAHLGRVADPAAGSYYVEALTDRLGTAAWAFFQEIEARGGLVEALREGFVQEQIAAVRDARRERMADRRSVMIGVNHYPLPDEEHLDDPPPAPLPLEHGEAPVDLDDGDVPAMRQAFEQGASLADVLHAAADDAEDAATEPSLPTYRAAAAFEALRLRTEPHAREHGKRPRVFVLPIAPASVRNARASFARDVFGCAGFAVENPSGFDTVAEGARAALDAGADLVVLCGADEDYEQLAPELCRQLHAASGDPPLVVVAGYPKGVLEALRAVGVDRFIHRRMNLLEALRAYQQKLGVTEEIQNPKSKIQNRSAS